VREQFPDAEQEKLTRHEDALKRTNSAADGHRARHCALWAIEHAKDKSASHPRWKQIKEAHEVWKNVWFGLEFGIGDVESRAAGPPEPLEDVKIEWTQEAVTIAKAIGEEDGWDASPWESLLVELIHLGESEA
jgi:hypothetical protein